MRKRDLIVTFVFLIFIISFANSAGVVRPYWDGYSLKMFPGEETEISLTLQNIVGDKNLSFTATIIQDGEGIASLIQKDLIYNVPLGRDDVNVPIRIEIPKDLVYGEVRQIEIEFKQVEGSGGGTVPISGGFSADFPVEIVVKENSTFYFYKAPEKSGGIAPSLIGIAVLLGILIIVAIVALLIRKRKKRS